MFVGTYSRLVIAKHIYTYTYIYAYTHTFKNNQTLTRSPFSLHSSPVPRVIEVGIPVDSRTTHATLEPSFLVGDAFITVKVLCLGLYTMHYTQAFLRIKKRIISISPYF